MPNCDSKMVLENCIYVRNDANFQRNRMILFINACGSDAVRCNQSPCKISAICERANSSFKWILNSYWLRVKERKRQSRAHPNSLDKYHASDDGCAPHNKMHHDANFSWIKRFVNRLNVFACPASSIKDNYRI